MKRRGSSGGAEHDDLRAGATANVVAQLARASNPALLVLLTRTYGAEAFGQATAAQGLVYLAARLGLFGLDRSLAYHVPRAEAEATGLAVLGTVIVACSRGLGIACLLAGIAYALGARSFAPLLAVATVVPVVMLELLLQTAVALRRSLPAFLLRDVVGPLAFPCLALALFPLGLGARGLLLAQLGSALLASTLAWLFLRRLLEARGLDARGHLPERVRRRARSLGFADLALTAMVRIDTPLVAVLASPSDAGVYAVVTQIANTLRSIRTSYEGVVTSAVSRVQAERDAEGLQARVRGVVGRAATLLGLVQLPLVCFFLAFGEEVLACFGDDFVRGARGTGFVALAIAVQGILGLAGPAAIGLGRTRAPLIASLSALLVSVVGMLSLVPVLGLDGACLALGGAALVHGFVQRLSLRVDLGKGGTDSASWRATGVLVVVSAGTGGVALAASGGVELVLRLAIVGATGLSAACAFHATSRRPIEAGEARPHSATSASDEDAPTGLLPKSTST